MPQVVVPPPYRGPTRGSARVAVEGETVGQCLEALESAHPGFLPQVLAADGSVHGFVRLFRNGEQLDGDVLAEQVAPDDEVEILAAIAGG